LVRTYNQPIANETQDFAGRAYLAEKATVQRSSASGMSSALQSEKVAAQEAQPTSIIEQGVAQEAHLVSKTRVDCCIQRQN
jgi:hypothetical protein